MLVADFYGRKSTLDDGRSIEGQADDYTEDCDEHGFAPGRQFQDPDRSASRFARRERPDYEALVEHIESGQCQVVSLWESSRGGRDLGPWIAFLDLCRKKGTLIRVISHRRTYDIRNRRDWRTLAEDGINSADESELISERVKRGKRKSAKRGRPTARLAYGFRRLYDERGTFIEQVEHPEQAPIVREIVTGLDEGRSAGGIARELNRRGIPVPQRPCPDDCAREHKHLREMVWTDSQVRQLALRPAIAGKRVHLGEIVGDGQWEPLVDPEMWQRVYDTLTAPGRRRAYDTQLAHWLTSAIQCGLCSAKLETGQRRGNSVARKRAYRCDRCHGVSSSCHQIEAFLEPLIDERLHLPDTTALFAPQVDSADVRAAEAELKRLEDRLAEWRAEGRKPTGLSAAAVAEAEQGLTPLIDAARAKVKGLALPASAKAFEGVDVTKWKGWNPRARRDLVLAVAYIVLAPGSRGGHRTFDPWRLSASRWAGDTMTWGERWQAEGWVAS